MPVKYEAVREYSRLEIEKAIAEDDIENLIVMVLSVSLYCEDFQFAQGVCVKLAKHKNFNIRGNAIQGFGHIARVHEKLDKNSVKPIVEGALVDKSEYVRGQADSSKTDIELYLKWKFDN